MQLSLEASVIHEALRVVMKLAAPVSGAVTIQSDGKGVTMHSASDVNRCSYKLPATVKGKAGVFAIAVDALSAATKGRKTIEMIYDKTVLTIKSGSYSTKLSTADALQLEYDEEKKSDKIKITGEQAVWLKQAVQSVALKPTAILSAYMPLSIKLAKKGAFIACYDTQHMAFLTSKEIEGEMDLTLPLDTLQAVLDTFNASAFKMEMSAANLYVTNALINVVLALPQAEENALTAEEVRMKAKEASDINGKQIEIPKKEVIEFIDNARSVMTKERGELNISTEPGKVKFMVTTVNGSSKVTIKANVKKEIKIDIDYEYFEEAIRKCEDSVIMKVVGQDFIMFQQKKATVLVALNQGTEKEKE
jgi:hypothetical protein